jgi:aspartate carbamoyltransferase catalytic subunit
MAGGEVVTASPAQPARNLLGLQGLSGADIVGLLDAAADMRKRSKRGRVKLDDLEGRTACLLFFEASTRTMNSFAAAGRALSADVVVFTAGSTSATAKGETLLDTAANLEAIGADVFVLRHKSSGAPHMLAKWLAGMRRDRPAPGVVNAGDGWHEHPTQALLDMLTLRDRFDDLRGLKVAILGDILHSRVARSNVWGLTACGADVTLVAPPAWIPEGCESLRADDDDAGGVRVSTDIDDVVKQSDAIIALRIQNERLGGEPGPSGGAFASEFGLNAARMRDANPKCVIMHPGPINRGVELASDLADTDRSIILEQVSNGVYVRMAVLAMCARRVKARKKK